MSFASTNAYEIDHVLVMADLIAPQATILTEFGLTEGPPNVHCGHGTACRRFFFRNAMLELLRVENAAALYLVICQTCVSSPLAPSNAM
jgi:hypothetical protein